MSDNTGIEWCDSTWSPIVGCSKVSAGCANCYAERMARRLALMGQKQYQQVVHHDIDDKLRTWNGKTALVESAMTIPMKWRKPRRIFVCSMSDLFHESVPFAWIDRVFAVMALCPQHTFMVLTKRPERMAEYLDMETKLDAPGGWPPRNIMLGTSVEDQKSADERIPHLLKCPAAVRFLSVEPMLGTVKLWTSTASGSLLNLGPVANGRGVDWVIVGGEYGPGARPCNVDWIRVIVAQCKAASVPCFVKQVGAKPYEDARDGPAIRSWGDAKILLNGEFVQIQLNDRKGKDITEWPEDLRVRQWPEVAKGPQHTF